MLSKIGGTKFKLNPCPRPQLAVLVVQVFAFAVGKSLLQRLDRKPKFPAHHAEKIHDALFVDRRVAKSLEVNRFAKELRRLPLSADGILGLIDA